MQYQFHRQEYKAGLQFAVGSLQNCKLPTANCQLPTDFTVIIFLTPQITIMKKLLGLLACSALLFSCNNEPKTAEATGAKAVPDSTATISKDVEIGDTKYITIAKKHMAFLESGDIDGWMADLSDNAVYRWNNFDSLVGKPAITDYWKKRRTDVIDSMSFSADIWLALKVHQSQAPGHLTGNYAMSWYVVSAKYKTGKSMKQRIHTAFHFDANDKIDRISQYLDRALINAAMAK
jgi:ketosteroid isomerase-like protein